MLFQYLFKNISNLVEIWTSLGVEFHNIHHTAFFFQLKEYDKSNRFSGYINPPQTRTYWLQYLADSGRFTRLLSAASV